MAQLLLRGTVLGDVKAVLFDKDGTLSISEPQLITLAEARVFLCLERVPQDLEAELRPLLLRAYGLKQASDERGGRSICPAGITAVASREHNLIATATALVQVGLGWPEALSLSEEVFALADRIDARRARRAVQEMGARRAVQEMGARGAIPEMGARRAVPELRARGAVPEPGARRAASGLGADGLGQLPDTGVATAAPGDAFAPGGLQRSAGEPLPGEAVPPDAGRLGQGSEPPSCGEGLSSAHAHLATHLDSAGHPAGGSSRTTEGLRDWLEQLRAAAIPCAVISNDDVAGIEHFLASHGLEPYFQAIWSAEHRPRKPDPAAVHGLCAELGLAAADCALIGDANSDLRMAVAAGIPHQLALGYTAAWSTPPPLAEPHPLVHHWRELSLV